MEKGERYIKHREDTPKGKVLALIPARGGSKRIPRKNIREFRGQPIIKYSIDAALESRCFDEVMVSTDDKETADIALKSGAKVPFFRSAVASGDHAVVNDVIFEVISEYKKQDIDFKYLCCLFATAPFISPNILSDSFRMLKEKNFDAVIPVVQYGHPIQRAFKVADGLLSMLSPENFRMRTQDLQPAYYDSGMFYWLNVGKFCEKKAALTENTGAYFIPECQCHDIDTEEDWENAEILYELSLKKGRLK